LAQRSLGVRSALSGSSGVAPSGAWFCPHGGGKAWVVSLELANPGPELSTVRVITYSSGKPSPPKDLTVQPGTTEAVPVRANDRASASLVEWFGGWLAAGWIARGGGGQIGEAAEPCAPQAGTTWFVPDGDTTQGHDAFIIVMNPFAVDADLTVQLLTGGTPFAPGKYNPFILRPYRAVAIDVGPLKKGFQAVAAKVSVAAGRVAVASLGVSDAQGIRAVIGTLGNPAGDIYLSSSGGSHTTVVAASTDGAAAFSGSLLQTGRPQPLNGLTQANLPQSAAGSYSVTAGSPSTIQIVAKGGPGTVVAAARVQGPGHDEGATGGSTEPASGWVVTPTVSGSPSHPGLVLTNPGSLPVTVTLHLLAGSSSTTQPDVQVTIPPTSAVGAPTGFLAADPAAAVLATSSDGAFLATGASASGGVLGMSNYAIAQGLPIPIRWMNVLPQTMPSGTGSPSP
jgi:hypothetical protein